MIKKYLLFVFLISFSVFDTSCHKTNSLEAKTIAIEEFSAHCKTFRIDTNLFNSPSFEVTDPNSNWFFMGCWKMKSDPEVLIIIHVSQEGEALFAGQNTKKIPREK